MQRQRERQQGREGIKNWSPQLTWPRGVSFSLPLFMVFHTKHKVQSTAGLPNNLPLHDAETPHFSPIPRVLTAMNDSTAHSCFGLRWTGDTIPVPLSVFDPYCQQTRPDQGVCKRPPSLVCVDRVGVSVAAGQGYIKE